MAGGPAAPPSGLLQPDRRADIWAFGVVLFEMLSGRRLFAGDRWSLYQSNESGQMEVYVVAVAVEHNGDVYSARMDTPAGAGPIDMTEKCAP